MRLALAICLCLLGAVTHAQTRPDFPAVYDVIRVAARDVLNIRAEPMATAPTIGTYGPDDTGIEVIRTTDDGRWGMVGVGERNGWVRMSFLTPGAYVRYPIAFNYRCFGTEPFWSFDMANSEYNAPETGVIETQIIWPTEVPNGFFVEFDRDRLRGRMIVGTGYCSDGMSDREYGYPATLLLQNGLRSRVSHGCCTTDSR